jgi:hypothetical protein
MNTSSPCKHFITCSCYHRQPFLGSVRAPASFLSRRKPDAQIVNANGKTRKVFEAERHPNRKRNKEREEEYKKLKLPNETHPLK